MDPLEKPEGHWAFGCAEGRWAYESAPADNHIRITLAHATAKANATWYSGVGEALVWIFLEGRCAKALGVRL